MRQTPELGECFGEVLLDSLILAFRSIGATLLWPQVTMLEGDDEDLSSHHGHHLGMILMSQTILEEVAQLRTSSVQGGCNYIKRGLKSMLVKDIQQGGVNMLKL
jgi:hypothetical protein